MARASGDLHVGRKYTGEGEEGGGGRIQDRICHEQDSYRESGLQ